MTDKTETIERDELIIKGVSVFSGAGVFMYMVDPIIMRALLQPMAGAAGVYLGVLLVLSFVYHRVYLDAE